MNEADDQFIAKAIQVKRQAALRRLAQAQAIISEAQKEEQSAQRDLAELDVAERVLRDLPSNDEQLAALDSPMSLRSVLRRGLSVDPSTAVVHGVSEETVLARSLKVHVLRECHIMLRDGSWKSTEELYAGLVERGLVLRVANPPQRLSQILGADPHFRSQRGRGWSLAGISWTAINQTEADKPGAIALEDERMRQQARRVVDDEHSGARYHLFGEKPAPK